MRAEGIIEGTRDKAVITEEAGSVDRAPSPDKRWHFLGLAF